MIYARTNLSGLMGILVCIIVRPASPMDFTTFSRVTFIVLSTTRVAKREKGLKTLKTFCSKEIVHEERER